MPSREELYTALRNADAAGDSESVRKLSAYLKQAAPSQTPAERQAADRELYSPTKGMSGTEKFVAGYGKALPDLVRGARQVMGAIDPITGYVNKVTDLQGDVDEAKRLDAPLMKTGAGLAGNITGNVVAALPTVAAGPSVAAAAGTGGLLGLMQPTATGESRTENALLGAALGPAGVYLGRGLGAVYQGGKALIEPFTQAGRERIGGRVIQRFAENPASLATANSRPTITGARPTLAEQTGDAGVARLQDSLRSVDPQINNQIGGRLAENNAARVSSLRDLAGEGGARDFAVANRGGTAEQLYEAAFQANSALSPSQLKAQQTLLKGGRIQALLETPAIADAQNAARTIAANRGKKLDDPSGSIEGLHYMKLAMDDAISAAKRSGTAAGENLASSIQSAQKRLVTALETLSPDYKAARVTYAQMSKPVNSMDVAAQVAKKGLSNGSDLSGTPTINRNALMGAMRDERSLMKQATGRDLGNDLANVMEPQDLNMLRTIVSESDRAGAVAAAGNGPGSATAQRMASQNVLRQIVGPLGLPSSWAENALANTVIGKPLNLVYGGVVEPRIQQALARAVLDPDAARTMLLAAQQQGLRLPPNALQQLTAAAGRSLAPVGGVAQGR